MIGLKVSSYHKAAAIIFLILISSGVYLNTLHGEFVSDDIYQVLQNEWIRDFRHIPRILFSSVWAFLPEGGESNYYRPFMYIFYSISYKLSGLQPWGYHLINIFLHSINAVLVFLVASILFNQQRVLTPIPDTYRLTPAFITALLFAIHPINTEAVAWVAGVPELSFTLFFLLSFYFYTKGRHLLSAMMFCFSIFSKENALILPVLLFLYDIFLKREPFQPLSRHLKRYWPFAVAMVFYFGLRLYAIGGIAPFMPREGERLLTKYQYLLNIMPLVTEYLWKLILPMNLTFYTYIRFEPLRSIIELKTIVFIVSATAFVYLFIKIRKQQPLVVFSFAGIILSLLPVIYSGWTKAAPMFAERYLYLSSVWYAIIVSVIFSSVLFALKNISEKSERILIKGLRALPVIILSAMVVLYSAGTIKRNTVWRSAYILWKDTSAKAPGNVPARVSYGTELAKRGMLDEALGEYEAALLLEPYRSSIYNNIGIIYAQKGFLKEAIEKFQEALVIEPNNMEAKKNLEKALQSSHPYSYKEQMR